MDESMEEKRVTSQADVNKHIRRAGRTDLLKLAMDWNCVDVAKELILQNSLKISW